MTTNFEIMDLLKPVMGKNFGGVYSKDQLQLLKPSNKFWIINLGNRETGGTHWTLVSDYHPTECYYYDSFGLSPPDEILKFMSRASTKKTLKYQDMQHQAITSDWCGEFCCFVALLLFHKLDFKTVCEKVLTRDIERNEALVKGLITRE